MAKGRSGFIHLQPQQLPSSSGLLLKVCEIAELTLTRSGVIMHLKSIFSRHGIPEKFYSDNGPQFTSQRFADFAAAYGFTLVTSSPEFAQSNGEAEHHVQTVKRLLKKASDPYLALLAELHHCLMATVLLIFSRGEGVAHQFPSILLS